MAGQRSEPRERSYQEALATLQRLASAGQPPPAPPTPEALSLTPRAAPLPAWSEQSLRELVENLPDAVVVINVGGSIVLTNRQTERMFGYPREELLGAAIEVLVPERLRGRHVALRDGYLAAPRTRPLGAGMELFGRRRDGSEFPVEISLSPMGSGPGLLVTAVVRDLSERKRNEAKFRTLVENIPAVTFVAPLDDSTPELYVSPQIESLLGFTQKEWVEDPVLWHRQLHPEDRDRWNRDFAPTCASGKPFRSTYRFLAKDGRTVWVHGSANLVRDEYDRMLFLQGVAFDVTAIKEAEEERERFFALSLDLFCVAGLDGYFRRVNQAFGTVLGYGVEELLRQPFLELVHPDDREATRQQLAGLARGEPTERFENRYRCRDGSYRWLQWVAAPFPERQLCFAAARDVTREKQDEESLREQARLAALRADVSAAITGGDTLAGMLGRCVQALADDFDAALVRVWTFDEGAGVLRLLAGAGRGSPPDWPDATVALGQGKIGRIAARREPFCTNDVAGDERIRDHEWARRVGLAAFAGYPLLIEDRLVGVLALYARRTLSPATGQTLELIAAQVSLGIQRKQAEDALLRANAELDRRVRERTEQLSHSLGELDEQKKEMENYAHHATHDIRDPLRNINTAAQKAIQALQLAALRDRVRDAIARASDLPDLLSRCVAVLTGGLAAEAAQVWLLDEQRGDLTLAAGPADGPTRVAVGQGLVGQVADQREPYFNGRKGAPAVAVCPLLLDRLVGVLAVSWQGRLEQAHKETLAVIAAQIAIAVTDRQAACEPAGAWSGRAPHVAKHRENVTSDLAALEEKTQEAVVGGFAKITAQAARLDELLKVLKRYADVNVGSQLKQVDCNEAVQVARGSLEVAIDESQAEVVAGELPTVTGMKEPLELLFQNLISNAIKYRAPERAPRVEVGARRQADGWLFWVRDNGVGIDPKYWPKIFGIGSESKVDERKDLWASGWGYGLAICEKTVARHGGRIWVESEPGQGSTFYFTLPDQPPGWKP